MHSDRTYPRVKLRLLILPSSFRAGTLYRPRDLDEYLFNDYMRE